MTHPTGLPRIQVNLLTLGLQIEEGGAPQAVADLLVALKHPEYTPSHAVAQTLRELNVRALQDYLLKNATADPRRSTEIIQDLTGQDIHSQTFGDDDRKRVQSHLSSLLRDVRIRLDADGWMLISRTLTEGSNEKSHLLIRRGPPRASP